MANYEQAKQAYQQNNFSKARKLFEKAAQEGNLDAQRMLAWMCSHGEGGPEDPADRDGQTGDRELNPPLSVGSVRGARDPRRACGGDPSRSSALGMTCHD